MTLRPPLLTVREYQVLLGISRGRETLTMANQLHVCGDTVKAAITSLYQILRVERGRAGAGRGALTRVGFETGFLFPFQPEPSTFPPNGFRHPPQCFHDLCACEGPAT